MTQTAKELPATNQRMLGRSIWAVALYLGFRLIGVVMVGALLWLPYMEIRYSRLTPAGILAAILALRSFGHCGRGCRNHGAWRIHCRMGH